MAEFKLQSLEGSLPPQNLEAEELILGGILMDPEAMSRVVDLIDSKVFYISAHRDIFQAARILHSQGKPTDLTTVTSALQDQNLLDKVGGKSKLAQLAERTVSAVNIDRYAALVMDKYLRRQLIAAGHDIVNLGYDSATDLESVLDQSEQKVFALTGERSQQGLVAIAETLVDTFNQIESLNENIALPGITCSFYDLDAMTSGFQRSDLIIIAGRPSMGKTAFALNIAHNIALEQNLPIAIFSLEMSKEQLAQRLLASSAEIESNRLRSGRITQNEYPLLFNAFETLSNLPIFIEDTPNLTVAQMRSGARRLQAERGGKLGLVLIDYLQLMEGSGDNRVQELSKITRSLKGLARELNAPVIALSQLSRGVEQRTNKRPMMSDLRESGCLTGESLVYLPDYGYSVPIASLMGQKGFRVMSLNTQTWQTEAATVTNAFCTGVKPVYKMTTALGRSIRATGNHKFLTIKGWKHLDKLTADDYIAVPRSLPNQNMPTMTDAELALLRHFIGDGCVLPRDAIQDTKVEKDLAYCGTGLYKQNVSREPAAKVAQVVQSDELKKIAGSDVYWDRVISIEADGEETVYDLTVLPNHNFICMDIYTHNSIEQDADLVLMLYRDAYYNSDSPDRDIAEIIITKHRNGPTGTIKLIFNPQFTKFRNLQTRQEY